MPVPASRSIAPVRTAYQPMPWVSELTDLYGMGVNFRQGQLFMIAGQPGSGKSLFAQWLCDKWNLPCMYVSMDMSPTDTVTRLGSLKTGYTFDRVKQAFEKDDDESVYIESEIDTSLTDFVFDDAPTLRDLVKELCAYVEMYGEWPRVFVLDNLLDIDHESQDKYEAWQNTILWLKSLARLTKMTVIIIHHARELEKSDYPSPRRDLAGKPSQSLELTFTVSLTPEGKYRIAVVKNRGGQSDPSAERGVQFVCIPSRMIFRPDGLWQRPPKRGQGGGEYAA